MTLADTIARIEARGVELPETREWQREGWRGRGGYDEDMAVELLAALDEATAMLKEAALDHVLDNEAGFEIDDPTVGEYVTEYLDDPRRRVAVITDAKRGEA